jgi:hypothetical protein
LSGPTLRPDAVFSTLCACAVQSESLCRGDACEGDSTLEDRFTEVRFTAESGAVEDEIACELARRNQVGPVNAAPSNLWSPINVVPASRVLG